MRTAAMFSRGPVAVLEFIPKQGACPGGSVSYWRGCKDAPPPEELKAMPDLGSDYRPVSFRTAF